MSNIEVYDPTGQLVALRDMRRAARIVSRHQAVAQVRQHALDTDTDIAVSKVEALTEATGSAMSAVVRVTQAQTQWEQLVPQASARLNYLADEHMLAMGDVVADLRRDLRRR